MSAGLIITEEHATHPTGWAYEKLIRGYVPEAIPGYRRLTRAVHAHDVPLPEATLWRQPAAAQPPFEVLRVGDCVAPRRAHAAIIEGERAEAAL